MVDLAAVELVAATLGYTDFLLATASLRDVGLTCAAMTPCMRLYAYLGQALSGRSQETYGEWVTTYAAPGFDALAATLERLLDRHATDTPAVRRAYRRVMQLELAFFEGACGDGGR